MFLAWVASWHCRWLSCAGVGALTSTGFIRLLLALWQTLCPGPLLTLYRLFVMGFYGLFSVVYSHRVSFCLALHSDIVSLCLFIVSCAGFATPPWTSGHQKNLLQGMNASVSTVSNIKTKPLQARGLARELRDRKAEAEANLLGSMWKTVIARVGVIVGKLPQASNRLPSCQ